MVRDMAIKKQFETFPGDFVSRRPWCI